MSTTSDERSPKATELRSEGWLESWKEIAGYLRRSVRSARRWEKEEGLPIHRHPHARGDSVYAYKAELDAWWQNRGAGVRDSGAESAAATPPVPEESAAAAAAASAREPEAIQKVDLPKKPRTAFLLGVGLSVAVLVGVAWVSRREASSSPKRPALPFEAREWVLVSAFENRSGQAQLDGTIEYALERELSNSRYVNVVPRERIGDALRLMRKPPDTRVDSAVGREICLRDGEIRALITGRIEKAGPKYLLTAELIDPAHGTPVASDTEEAAGDAQILPAARRISDRVRTMLGEDVPVTRGEDGTLEKVTTPSLSALRLYSQADALIKTGGDAAAEELLRQAVAEDPEFASAHLLLGYSIYNQGRPTAEYLPEMEKAFLLSERTTERERYFIRGSYYFSSGQKEKGIAALEALLSIYPDHFWALNNLSINYPFLGREKDGARMAVRLANLRPKDFGANSTAAWDLARLDTEPDPALTTLYVRRAQSLVSPEVVESGSFDVAWVELYDARDHWLNGDAAGALALATTFEQRWSSTSLLKKDDALSQLGCFYVILGRLKKGEEIFHREVDPSQDLASLALLRKDREEFARYSGAIFPRTYDQRLEKVGLLIRGGFVNQAEKDLAGVKEVEEASFNQGMIDAVRGELAMARGDAAETIRQLTKCQEKNPNVGRHYFLWGIETLASAMSRQGDLSGAIRMLEQGLKHKRKAISVSNGVLWEQDEVALARLYRKAGRLADAQRVESELARLVAVADSDDPILVDLRRLQGGPTLASAAPATLIH